MTGSNAPGCCLALGTVQFGLDYGITNDKGKPCQATVAEILSIAAREGIGLLDTASGYGDSEKVLGLLADESDVFSVMTKTPNWNGAPTNESVQEVASTFEASLRHLKRTGLWGLMVHFAQDLLSDQGEKIWRAMEAIKASGKVARIGISFYADDPIDDLAAKFKPDFVQLPVNALDQSLVKNGQLERLHTAGIEIHARSVFLQGILLSSVDRLPDHLKNLETSLQAFQTICGRAGISQLEGALAFARSCKELSRLVIGVATPTELAAVCKAFDAVAQTSLDWRMANCGDTRLTDPRYWSAA
jgi:aryl-alcohol dehydrogenase-like predicted oxidoreductase